MNTKLLKMLLIPLALILIAGLARAASDDGTVIREFKVSSSARLVIDHRSGGSAKITAWDKDLIKIEYYDDRNDLKYWDIEFKQDGDTVKLVTELDRSINSSSLGFEFHVPKRCDLEFESAGGSIDISGVEGTFEGETAGGSMVISDCKGDVDLRSGGGTIRVTDSELDGRMKTGGGKVLVQNVVGNLKASSGGGEVRYKNVRSSDGAIRGPGRTKIEGMEKDTVVISNAGGGIRVKDAPDGALVKTGGGNVRVSGADKFVKAETGGGDIEISLNKGWVVAKTGAGDIEVELLNKGGDGDLEIRSGYGDIYLTVPKDLGMDFDIDLMYTRNSDRDFEIKSDFKMDTEHTKDWERDHGTPRKHIYGTGEVNGGGRRVYIKTTNGDIIIRKK